MCREPRLWVLGVGGPLSLVILTAVPAAPPLGSGHPGPPLPTHEWLCSLPSHVILGAKAAEL